MIYNCKTCGILWTSKNSTDKVDPKRAPSKTCSDCETYDWPIWNKRLEQVRSWLGDPTKKKAKDEKSKTTKTPR